MATLWEVYGIYMGKATFEAHGDPLIDWQNKHVLF